MPHPIILLCVYALLCSMTAGCHSDRSHAGPFPVRWTSKIPLAHIAQAELFLRQPVKPGISMAREGSGGRTDEVIAVDTGAQYVKALKDGFQPHLGVDLFLSGGFTLADCVAQLQEAKASPKSYLSDFRLDRVSLRKLPAELSPMVSGEQFEAAEGKNGWADPSAKVKKADRERLVIHGDDGQVTLWIAGWGDFDEDGVEDILLGAYYDFSPGSLSYGTTVLITKVTVNGPLRPVRKRPKK